MKQRFEEIGSRKQEAGSALSTDPLLPSSFFLSSSFLLFVAALGLYTVTLAPGLLPADSGEFQITGALLGVAHPPGFAGYTLLSWLISRLPFVSPAVAINCLSALLAALALVCVSGAVRAWTGSMLAGLFAALALGCATTFWAQATTANVRMYTAGAVSLALLGLAEYTFTPGTGSRRVKELALALFAFAAGLAVSHHGSTIFLIAALGLYALLAYAQRDWSVVRLMWAGGLQKRIGLVLMARQLWPLLFGLLPFLSWAYFLFRVGAYGAPPNLGTWDGYLDHVLARNFLSAVLAFATPELFPDRLRVLWVILNFQWNGILLALALLGVVRWMVRDWKSGGALLAAFVAHTFVSITYAAPQTTEYLLPAFVLLAVFMGFGFAEILRWLDFTPAFPPAGSTPARALLALPLLALALGGLLLQYRANFPGYRQLAQDDSTRAFAQALLELAPRDAVLLAPWHWATPLWYLREVEGQRPDVEVRYVVPRGMSYAQNWVDEIGQALPTRPVIVTSFFPNEYAASGYRFLPLPTPHFPAWRVYAQPLTESPANLQGARTWGELEFLGFHSLSAPSVQSLQSVDLIAAWRVAGPPRDLGFFVHALGPDGRLYGQQDVSVPASRYIAGEVLANRYTVTLLPDAAPGTYTLVAGAYLPDGTRLAETTLTTITVTPRTAPPPTRSARLMKFPQATLVGEDVDRSLSDAQRLYQHFRIDEATTRVPGMGLETSFPRADSGYVTVANDFPPGYALPFFAPSSRYVVFGDALVLIDAHFSPARARPGEAITVDVEFIAARSLTQDLIVKVELTGNGWRAQLDTVPVGGGLPTLKWIAGSRLRDRYTLTVPADAAPGPAQLTLGWYDAFTQRTLPLLDPRLAQLGPNAPLGIVEIGE
jgi:hypothetical protein